MTLRGVLTLSMLLALLASCSAPYSDLKSPCVGAQGSPCERRPINDWWLNPKDEG